LSQEAQITKQEAVQTAKIAQEKAVETANIDRQKTIEAAKIAKEQEIKVADEQRLQAVAEAEVARETAVALKRQEEAIARASQADAEAKQQEAEEKVVTVKARAVAAREKTVVTIKAEEEAAMLKIAADRDAYVKKITAEGDKQATVEAAQAEKAEAQGQADATRAVAQGQADAEKLKAQGQSDAVRLEAEAYAFDKTTRANANHEASSKEAEAQISLAAASLKKGQAVAESRKLLVEAENAVSDRILTNRIALAAIEKAPAIAAEIMAPVAQVSKQIQVIDVNFGGDGDSEIGGIAGSVLKTGLVTSGLMPLVTAIGGALWSDPSIQAIADAGKRAVTDALADATGNLADNGSGQKKRKTPPAPRTSQ